MLNSIIESSISLSLVKKLESGYGYVWGKIKTCFKYSFLGRITEVKDSAIILYNSRFVRWLSDVLRGLRLRTTNYQGTSAVIKTTTGLKREVRSFPLKAIGIILYAATLTDILFSAVLNKETELFGWITKVMLLSLGIGSIYSDADWEAIKETSLFLRFMNIVEKYKIRLRI